MSGLQKLVSFSLLAAAVGGLFYYNSEASYTSNKTDHKIAATLVDMTPTEVNPWDFYGEQSIDIDRGEVVQIDFTTPNLQGFKSAKMSELTPGVLSIALTMSSGEVKLMDWDPDAPRDERPDYSTVQIWEEMNRVYIHTSRVEQTPNGMRFRYYAVNRPDLLPVLKGLERQYKQGQISQDEVKMRVERIFKSEGLLPENSDMNARLVEILDSFY